MYPEDLNKVKNKAFLIVIIRMQEAHIRIKSGYYTSFLDLRIQDSVAVIKKAVKSILRRIRVVLPSFECQTLPKGFPYIILLF
jgi:hypothetical protein